MNLLEKRSALIKQDADLAVQIGNLKAKIQRVKGDGASRRRFVPPQVLEDLQRALVRLGVDHQHVARELGEVNREIRRGHALGIEARFVYVCRLKLPRAQYDQLMAQAVELYDLDAATNPEA